MTDDVSAQLETPQGHAVPYPLLWILRLLALSGLGLAGFLFWRHFNAHGCGECAGVISGEWGHLLHVPVSVFAAATYLMVLLLLILPLHRLTGHLAGRVWFLLSILCVVIVGSGLWFVYLQEVALNSRRCLFCMAEHGVGAGLAALVWFAAFRASALRQHRVPLSLAIGLGAVAIFATAQFFTHTDYLVPESLVGQSDSMGNYIEKKYRVSLRDGMVRLNPDAHLLLGPHDADRYIVTIIDYTCPNCARVEPRLRAVQKSLGPRYAIVVLLYPLNPNCNSNFSEEQSPKHRDACELARLASAVWMINPEKFSGFHDWLFEHQADVNSITAQAEAARLVGEIALNQQLKKDVISEMIHRDVDITRLLGVDTTPGIFAGRRFQVIPEEDELLRSEIVRGFDEADAAKKLGKR